MVKIVYERTNYHNGGPGTKPQAAGQFLHSFFSEKKQRFQRHLDDILNVLDILNKMTCMRACRWAIQAIFLEKNSDFNVIWKTF